MKLRMEKAVYGGACLARVPADGPPDKAGKAVFVPFALPSELVEVTAASDRRNYLTATLDSVLEPAAERVTPPCQYYARCGGCHYQHADYAAQLAIKRSILAETLERVRVPLPSEIRTLSGEPWGYRNRIRLHVAQQPNPALAYREAASHRNLAVTHCPVAAPLLQQAIAAFNQFLNERPEAAMDLSEVECFTTADESALLVTIFTQPTPASKKLSMFVAEALRPSIPQLRGVAALSLNPRTRRVQQIGSWGERALDYTVGSLHYQVSAGAFFQVNRYLAPALLQEVVAARKGALAWDLYAGVGLFAQALAANFERVVAVESAAASSADLARNLSVRGHKQVSMDTLRFLQSPARTHPDLIVVDPPRAGLGAEVCRHLAAFRPKQIVYVSCDPATLARDLRALQPSGYRPVALTLIDLFPQTFHLETMATLERA